MVAIVCSVMLLIEECCAGNGQALRVKMLIEQHAFIE
jgi:hypothetical protein